MRAFYYLKSTRGNIVRMWRKIFRQARKRVVRKKPGTAHFKKHQAGARVLIHERLAYFAPLCGVVYKRVAIRNQRRRWGSCSSLGNLNFNYRLVFLPPELCDYVIVHELCHLKQMNHGPLFWAEVEKVLPNYVELEMRLKQLEKTGVVSQTSSMSINPVLEAIDTPLHTSVDGEVVNREVSDSLL